MDKEFWAKQISLTEWLEKINYSLTEEMREEDNLKRERLRVLHDLTGVPFDEPVQFDALEIKEQSARFKEFLENKGHSLCALRLIPTVKNKEKLRMRGRSVKEAVEWFNEQNIEATKYKADFVPHSKKALWSTIFIVNEK